jgi:hypothetical protein
MKTEKLVFCAALSALSYLSACSFHENKIYCNLANQSILTCDNSYITSLQIREIENLESFVLQIKQNKNTKTHLSLNEFTDYFDVFYTGNREQPNPISLTPNKTYEIINFTNGDRASEKIIIKTGLKGELIQSDKTSCN